MNHDVLPVGESAGGRPARVLPQRLFDYALEYLIRSVVNQFQISSHRSAKYQYIVTTDCINEVQRLSTISGFLGFIPTDVPAYPGAVRLFNTADC